jgi:hypothetical protein
MNNTIVFMGMTCKACGATDNGQQQMEYYIWPDRAEAICKNGQMCQERRTRRDFPITHARQKMEVPKVSEARWCDYRDHPYKGGREGTVMMGRTETQPNGGQAYTQNVKEMCPECAAELGLNEYEAPKETPAERRALLQADAKGGRHAK